MMTSLRSRATLYVMPRFDRRKVARIVEAHRLSVFIGVPFMFAMWCFRHQVLLRRNWHVHDGSSSRPARGSERHHVA